MMIAENGPLVSVIVPSYARPDMVVKALESINAQTYSPIEAVVVDDNGLGSELQLETEARVTSFSPRDGVTLKYVPRVKNGGGAMARNSGIEACEAGYVAFLDDDDEYLPRKIEMQMDALRSSGADFCYAHCKALLDDGGEIQYRRICEGVPLFEQAYCGCIAATTQWLVKKDALVAVGCFTDTPAKQDSILLYKLLLAGYRLCCAPEVLSFYHQETGFERISTRGKTLAGERLYSKLIRDSYDRFTASQRRRLEHAIRWREGRLLVKQGKRAEGLPLLASAFVIAPVASFKKAATAVGRKAKR